MPLLRRHGMEACHAADSASADTDVTITLTLPPILFAVTCRAMMLPAAAIFFR